MNVISFVVGTELHKKWIVDMVKERLPDDKVRMYNAAFIDDLFESSEDSDIIILDLEAQLSLREVMRVYNNTPTKIAVIVPNDEIAVIEEYLHFDIAGFFPVDMEIHEFVDGINYMRKDMMYVHPVVASTVFRKYKQDIYKETIRPVKLLTKREWEILGELVAGCQNEDIARNLNISDKTVKNHITSILGKLGVKDRTKAVLLALKERWFYL